MKSYFEWKEDDKKQKAKEEKIGMDLDGDHEKGESPEHKKKIEKTKKELLEFFKKRREGARKIASEARSKGGPSELTAWHFAAKDKPYQEVLDAINTDKQESYFLSKCKNLLSKIKCGKMKQKDFQEVMGQLEVFGEAMALIFNDNKK